MSIEVEKHKHFVEFMIEFNYQILSEPINGDFLRVLILISKTHPDYFKSLDQFVNYINDFVVMFPNLLEIEFANISPKVPKLIWFNYCGFILLNHRINGNDSDLVPFKKNETSSDLRSLISSLHTRVEARFSSDKIVNNMFYVDFTTLNSILLKVSAKKILDKKKAAQVADRIPFLVVCNDNNHARVLSNFLLNAREYPNGITDNISTSYIQQVLTNYKNLIPSDIYNCAKANIHFLPFSNSHTETNLGDCSYLDACHKMKTCRYVHYYSLYPMVAKTDSEECKNEPIISDYTFGETFTEYTYHILPAQWISCDVRYLPFPILGKFAAIISDPAWDIHMSLPYGTCKDTELLSLPMNELQDEGIIMLWVTGRSIDVGRQALLKWGYEISNEMIWIKLNQLKRTIVTGRTGHWLNHSKEHLLVGLKGKPHWLTSKVDMDIVISGTRETSRKPDEIYGIVERIVGVHSRKLELFGRAHNTRPGWLTIGNQLKGVNLFEPELKMKYEAFIKDKENVKSGH